jgi:galactokinase
MIIGVSSQSKDTQGLLKKLKENALMSIEIVKNHDLDFSFTNIEKIDLNKYLSFLDDNLKPFFRAAIGNYRTTLKAKNEFYKNKLDIKKIADLINIHHSFLKNDLKITTPVIDDMIDIAMENGSIGCKIVGSGGGGSIVCLSEDKSSSIKIVNELKKYGVKDAFIAKIGKGPTISYE